MSPDDPRRAAIRIADNLLAKSVSAALSAGGWAIDESARLAVCDDPLTEDAWVLVVPPRPALCAAAVARVVSSENTVFAALCADEIDHLASALGATAVGMAVISQCLIQHASHAPSFSERQLAVLRELLGGSSNHEIAEKILTSESTVKRELSVIRDVLQVASRVDITREALGLGFGGSRRTRPPH